LYDDYSSGASLDSGEDKLRIKIMEYKQVQYYSVLMAGPVSSSGRLPRRGNIKKQIFASVAASILASPKALKRTGKALAKIIRASCNTCCPQKIYPTTSGLDLVREG